MSSTPSSGPSDNAVHAAVAAAGGAFGTYERQQRAALEAAHDPALGLDRSVWLRSMVEPIGRLLYERDAEHFERIGWDSDTGGMRDDYRELAADFIEREFGGGSS